MIIGPLPKFHGTRDILYFHMRSVITRSGVKCNLSRAVFWRAGSAPRDTKGRALAAGDGGGC